MMKQYIITVCASKGGCGKSSTCAAIAELEAIDGKNTLIIDLDAQANISMQYRAKLSTPGSYELITGADPLSECVQPLKKNLNIIHSTADISTLETGPASGKRLLNALKGSEAAFNRVIIDTGPGLSESLYNALNASQGVIIPLVTDMASLQAYYQITDIIRQTRNGGKYPKIIGVLITQYSRRANINRMYQDAIEKQCKADNINYLGEVRQCAAVRESQGVQKPLYEWAPKCKAATDYRAIYEKIKAVRL